MAKEFKVLGMMSGTSLDGMDLALVHLAPQPPYSFAVSAATTIAYPQAWQERLRYRSQLSAPQLLSLNADYSHFLAKQIKNYLSQLSHTPNLIAMHGHTYYHRPQEGYTFQLGNGAVVARRTGIATVSDFRSQDVALGGQGAPLVPVGDVHLFSQYDACLNLGGFSNISLLREQPVQAFDISPLNMALNYLAQRAGKSYDHNGQIARRGQVQQSLYQQMNALPYYRLSPPKSLGAEWFEEHFKPLLQQDYSLADLMATVVQHVAHQIVVVVQEHKLQKVLLTGGGAYHRHLRKVLEKLQPHVWCFPEPEVIDYKEAIIFAFMGMLRFQQKINVLSSVTGAMVDHSAGIVHLPQG